jgi:hypothetical protein
MHRPLATARDGTTTRRQTLARAKRTDRTEARRRYRAELAAETTDAVAEPNALAEAAEPNQLAPKGKAAGSRSRGTAPAAPSTGRPARPSFSASARAAYRSPNLREDLRVLPRLLIHWSVLLSAALAVVGTAVFVSTGAQAGSSNTASTVGYVSSMLVSLFVGPPPFGAALLVGFMLPRATYLVGFVLGILASLCFTVIILAQPAETTAGVSISSILLQVWVLGPVGTMFFAAAIAWYRRFLDLLNPNRGQRAKAGQKTSSKPQQGRGNAPRNRLSGSGR